MKPEFAAEQPADSARAAVHCMNLACRGRRSAGPAGERYDRKGFVVYVDRAEAEKPGFFVECNECFCR